MLRFVFLKWCSPFGAFLLGQKDNHHLVAPLFQKAPLHFRGFGAAPCYTKRRSEALGDYIYHGWTEGPESAGAVIGALLHPGRANRWRQSYRSPSFSGLPFLRCETYYLYFRGVLPSSETDPLRLRLNEKAFPWFPLGLRFSLFTSDVKVHLHPDKTGTNQSEVDIVDSGSRDEGSFCLWTVDPLFSVGCPRSKMVSFCLVSLQTPTPVVL